MFRTALEHIPIGICMKPAEAGHLLVPGKLRGTAWSWDPTTFGISMDAQTLVLRCSIRPEATALQPLWRMAYAVRSGWDQDIIGLCPPACDTIL